MAANRGLDAKATGATGAGHDRRAVVADLPGCTHTLPSMVDAIVAGIELGQEGEVPIKCIAYREPRRASKLDVC